MIGTETVQQQHFQDLVARIEALEKSSSTNRLALGVMTGNLDTTIAAFIIALGATAYDMEVDMFFTFWATAALRDPQKAPRKGFLDRMFGRMLPHGSRALPLSKMQMAGIGPKMIRSVMKQRGVKSLEELMKDAAELGVRIHVCEMSMGVMGLKQEEMISYPGMDFVGVGTFINMIQDARQVIFL
jgi:peroxiredoxin family protein